MVETSQTMAMNSPGLRKADLAKRTVCLHVLSQDAAAGTVFYPRLVRGWGFLAVFFQKLGPPVSDAPLPSIP